MNLRDYPRPPADTGWGFHDSAGYDCKPANPADYARRLRQEFGITWFKALVAGTNKVDLVEAFTRQGIEVVVRLYSYRPHPHYVVSPTVVRAYVDAGAHYFEWGNEPNLHDEWDLASWDEGARVDKVCNQFLRNADAIRQGGGIPLMAALTPGGHYPHRDWYRTTFEWLKINGHLRALEGAAIAVHNRPLNRPLGHLAPDGCCFLEYEWLDDLVRAYVGRSLPLLGTESGYEPGWDHDPTFPPIDLARHAEYNVEMLRCFGPHGSRRWRDSLYCQCLWLVESFGHHDFAEAAWFRNQKWAGGGDLPAVARLRQEWQARPFNRGGGAKVEPVPEPKPEPEPPTPSLPGRRPAGGTPMNLIGPHIIGGTKASLAGPQGQQPTVVKLVDCDAEAAYCAQVRQAVGPHTLLIWRRVTSQPLDNPVQRAREYVDRYLPEWLRWSQHGPVAFEGYNEVGTGKGNAEDWAIAEAYCVFEVERLRLMHEAGLRAVIGNFSVGHPHQSLWPVYKPMLDAMGPGDYLGLHEYWETTAELDDCWLCGRWAAPKVAPYLQGVPIVVTECGRGAGGWRGRISAEEYLAELEQYANILANSEQVLGATVFTAANNPNLWPAYLVDDMWSMVTARYGHLTWQQEEGELEQYLGERMQNFVIPQNPAAGFYQYGRKRGWEPISPEVDVLYNGITYRCQVWYTPKDRMQHIVYAPVGAWDRIAHFDRPN